MALTADLMTADYLEQRVQVAKKISKIPLGIDYDDRIKEITKYC